MKTARVVILAIAAVVLSIACSVFFLNAEKRTTRDAQAGVRAVRTDVAMTKLVDDRSQQPIRKKSSWKTVETGSGSQQPKRPESRIDGKPQTHADALPSVAAESSDERQLDVQQQIAKKYDQMFAGQDTKLFKDPFSAAHSLVEKEPVDEKWAPEASQLLADSFSDLTNTLNVSTINCRTDICEIRINSWPGENYSDINLAKDRLDLIQQQPWFKRYFDETTSLGAFLDDGLPLMVIFVTRK